MKWNGHSCMVSIFESSEMAMVVAFCMPVANLSNLKASACSNTECTLSLEVYMLFRKVCQAELPE